MRYGLVVEDIATVQIWLGKTLQEAFPGMEVTSAASVAGALDAVEACPPDVALLDLGLPDGDGLEVLKTILARKPDAYCIISTIFDDDRHLFDAIRAGARGYILKDQARDDLLPLLRGIIDGRPPLSPAVARRLLDHFRPAQPAQHTLTPRELEVLGLIAKGHTIAQSARLLGITPNTAAGYVKDIYRKLNVGNRAEATLEAARLGIVRA